MKKYRWILVDSLIIAIIVGLVLVVDIFSEWNWMWSTIVLISIYVFNVIFVFFSLINRDNPTEKLSWIFFMIFFPIVGHVFYCLFRLRRPKRKSFEEHEKTFSQFKINEYDEKKHDDNKIMSWQSLLVKRNFYKTKLNIYNHGYEAYEVLLNDLKKAKKYIHIEMYILKESEIYERVKKILINKVKEGVEVKIIFDRFGSWKVPIDEFKHLKNNGIDCCFFNIPTYPYVRHTDNKRLHRKFFLIDGEIVHFGGLNISDEYCSFSTKYGYWADSNFSAKGKIINEYESIFLYDWFKIKNEKLDKEKYVSRTKVNDSNSLILTFEESPSKSSMHFEDSLDYWINNSEKEIRIATPYFVPTDRIFNSLKNALKRGVKVDIFIPGKPDKKFTYKATLFHSNELSLHGANIHVYNDTFLHSKFGTFDNMFAYIGTNNFDMRSFYTNEESINLLFGDQVVKELNNMFNIYQELSIKHTYKAPKFIFVKTFAFKLVAPLM